MVSDLDRAVAFWPHLGFEENPAGRTSQWASLVRGQSSIGLHLAEMSDVASSTGPGRSRFALNLISDQPLEIVRDRLKAAGVHLARDITAEPWGRSMVVHDPDDTEIWIIEEK